MIDVRTAAELLDFGVRIKSEQRAREQLEGAVALHNTLCRRGVAYLADEVGMGKTYVALGVLALFRHFEPNFRVLVLSPRENIQRKWMKELGNFVRHNVRFADVRVKALDGRPARALVACENLLELVRETSVNDAQDFFGRLTSFSLPLSGDTDGWRRMRDAFRKYLSARPYPDDPLKLTESFLRAPRDGARKEIRRGEASSEEAGEKGAAKYVDRTGRATRPGGVREER